MNSKFLVPKSCTYHNSTWTTHLKIPVPLYKALKTFGFRTYNRANLLLSLLQELEQMRLERIRAQEEKDRQIAEALSKFAVMQTELKSKHNS